MRTSNSVHRPPLHRHNVRYITHKVSTFPQLKLKEKTKFKKKLHHIFYVTPQQSEIKNKLSKSLHKPTQPRKFFCSSKIINMCCATPPQTEIVTDNIILRYTYWTWFSLNSKKMISWVLHLHNLWNLC